MKKLVETLEDPFINPEFFPTFNKFIEQLKEEPEELLFDKLKMMQKLILVVLIMVIYSLEIQIKPKKNAKSYILRY